jgi:hypothetical protein
MNMGTGGVTIKTKAKVVGNGTRHSLATAA